MIRNGQAKYKGAIITLDLDVITREGPGKATPEDEVVHEATHGVQFDLVGREREATEQHPEKVFHVPYWGDPFAEGSTREENPVENQIAYRLQQGVPTGPEFFDARADMWKGRMPELRSGEITKPIKYRFVGEDQFLKPPVPPPPTGEKAPPPQAGDDKPLPGTGDDKALWDFIGTTVPDKSND